MLRYSSWHFMRFQSSEALLKFVFDAIEQWAHTLRSKMDRTTFEGSAT